MLSEFASDVFLTADQSVEKKKINGGRKFVKKCIKGNKILYNLTSKTKTQYSIDRILISQLILAIYWSIKIN